MAGFNKQRQNLTVLNNVVVIIGVVIPFPGDEPRQEKETEIA
jgi:hypothetical protein